MCGQCDYIVSWAHCVMSVYKLNNVHITTHTGSSGHYSSVECLHIHCLSEGLKQCAGSVTIQ